MKSSEKILDNLASDVARTVSFTLSRECSEGVQNNTSWARGRDYEFGLSFGLVYSTCSGMGLPGPDFDFVHTRALSIVFSIEDSEVLERWQRLKEKNEQDFIQGLSDAKRLVRVRAE